MAEATDDDRRRSVHPLVALYPGVRVPAANVDTHSVVGEDDVLRIHMTRYPMGPSDPYWQEPESLVLHLMALDPRYRDAIDAAVPAYWDREGPVTIKSYHQTSVASSASVVIGHAGDQPPLLALDDLSRRWPSAVVTAVNINRYTVLAWIRTHDGHWNKSPDGLRGASGYAVTLTAADPENPGPVDLYPSALYGWFRWWQRQADELIDDRHVTVADLPAPPPTLDIVEAWQSYRVRLSGVERTTFSTGPKTEARPQDYDWPQ